MFRISNNLSNCVRQASNYFGFVHKSPYLYLLHINREFSDKHQREIRRTHISSCYRRLGILHYACTRMHIKTINSNDRVQSTIIRFTWFLCSRLCIARTNLFTLLCVCATIISILYSSIDPPTNTTTPFQVRYITIFHFSQWQIHFHLIPWLTRSQRQYNGIARIEIRFNSAIILLKRPPI